MFNNVLESVAMLRILSFVVLALALSVPPSAAAAVDARIEGNRYVAIIDLAGGYSVELSLRFDNAVGLDVDALGVTAEVVDPLSLSLLSRLPSSTNLSIPVDFPVLVRIAPPAGSGLSFEGTVEVEFYTRNLKYVPGTPLRLYKAPPGGTFTDITDRVSGGSYRPRGSTGEFSDFLIVADLRLLPAVIGAKFDGLEQRLQNASGAIDPATASQLQQLVSVAQWSWQNGDPGAAVDAVTEFERVVSEAAAAGLLPRVWRSSRDLDNVDGTLRAAARTLRFSLNLAVNAL